MLLITSPEEINFWYSSPSVFLAGSIENGKADQWQTRVIEALKDENITIFNPRRVDWDWSTEQKIDNPRFREQVLWELHALETATNVLMYFDPTTKSPISLLEFGLFAKSGKLMVCCPDGFWRKGNVDIVCRTYGVRQFIDIEALIQAAKDLTKQ